MWYIILCVHNIDRFNIMSWHQKAANRYSHKWLSSYTKQYKNPKTICNKKECWNFTGDVWMNDYFMNRLFLENVFREHHLLDMQRLQQLSSIIQSAMEN